MNRASRKHAIFKASKKIKAKINSIHFVRCIIARLLIMWMVVEIDSKGIKDFLLLNSKKKCK